jgi:tetrahydromethanopterin S-methyltransferase subunit C
MSLGIKKMTNVENTKKPYLSISSIIFAVISLPVAKFLGDTIGPNEGLLGYASSGIVVIVLMIILSLGLILGLAGIYYNEQPKFLSFFAPILNSVALFWFLWLLIYMPS